MVFVRVDFGMLGYIKEICDAAISRDPAARSRIEVFFLYPSFWAISFYMVSNYMWRHRFYFLARWLSQMARFFTGIEIHPGATIGRSLFIDHGMGVVIGETAVLGDRVTLYQGVTLGGVMPAVGVEEQRAVKRHPTLEDGVIVGSGAQILGDIIIAKNARVGANAVVTKDVEANTVVVGIPASVVGKTDVDSQKAQKFNAYGVVSGSDCESLLEHVKKLERRINKLEKESVKTTEKV